MPLSIVSGISCGNISGLGIEETNQDQAEGTADQLGGAIVATDYVDLVLRGGDRVRAEVDGDCSGLGYYGGFYVKPSADGQVCAGRDSIRTRSGDQCTIRKFKKLVAKK